jgi:hypothetical protein
MDRFRSAAFVIFASQLANVLQDESAAAARSSPHRQKTRFAGTAMREDCRKASAIRRRQRRADAHRSGLTEPDLFRIR